MVALGPLLLFVRSRAPQRLRGWCRARQKAERAEWGSSTEVTGSKKSTEALLRESREEPQVSSTANAITLSFDTNGAGPTGSWGRGD